MNGVQYLYCLIFNNTVIITVLFYLSIGFCSVIGEVSSLGGGDLHLASISELIYCMKKPPDNLTA